MEHAIEEIFDRALNKAYSRVEMAKKDVYRIKNELKYGITDGLSQEEAEGLLVAQEVELQVWKYIYKVIEKEDCSDWERYNG